MFCAQSWWYVQVEELLLELEAAGSSLGPRATTLERAAGEASRLNFFALKGADLPFVQRLLPRIADAKTRLQVRAGL